MPDPTLSPPAQVRPAHSASERVNRAKVYAHAYEVAGRQCSTAARAAGAELIALKDELPPGEFISTLATMWPDLASRTAQRWMSVARNWKKIHAAATLVEAEEIAWEGEEAMDMPHKYDTVSHPTGQNDECEADDKANAGKGNASSGPKNDADETPEGPFDDLMKEVSRLARRFTEAMKEETPESKRLHDYLAWAGLVDHARGQIVDPTKVEGDGREKAGVAFLPLKGVKAVLELAAAPGPARTPNEVQHAYDVASGGFVPPITARRRKKKRKPGSTPTGYTDTEF